MSSPSSWRSAIPLLTLRYPHDVDCGFRLTAEFRFLAPSLFCMPSRSECGWMWEFSDSFEVASPTEWKGTDARSGNAEIHFFYIINLPPHLLHFTFVASPLSPAVPFILIQRYFLFKQISGVLDIIPHPHFISRCAFGYRAYLHSEAASRK